MDKDNNLLKTENEKLKKDILKMSVQMLAKNKQIAKCVRLTVTQDQELGKRNKEIKALKGMLRETR